MGQFFFMWNPFIKFQSPNLIFFLNRSTDERTHRHHKACQVMTNGDSEGQIFLSDPHTNNGFFFLLNIKYPIFMFKKAPRRDAT